MDNYKNYYDPKIQNEFLEETDKTTTLLKVLEPSIKENLKVALSLGFCPEQFYYLTSTLLNTIVTEYQLQKAYQTLKNKKLNQSKENL